MTEHERAVVGAVLVDERVLEDVLREVEPEDFADDRWARVLRGVRGMRAAGEPVDVITASSKLPGWGVHGVDIEDLYGITDLVTTAASGPYYAALVREDAVRRRAVEVAGRLRQDVAGEPVGAVRAAIEDLEAIQARAVPQKLEAFSPAQLLSVSTSYDWVIEGLLERRERVMVTGPEGFGKSTFIRQLAFTTAAGVHPFRDYQSTTPRRVLVVDAENSLTQWARQSRGFVDTLTTVDAAGTLDENLRVAPIRRVDLATARDLGVLHRLCDEHEPDVVSIGPLYRLVPRAIMTDDEAAPLLAALDTLRDRGIALIIEAHAGKATEANGARSLAPRGSSALLGWPEFGIGLRPVKGQPNAADLVRWRGDRDERMWPSRLAKSKSGLPWQAPEPGGHA